MPSQNKIVSACAGSGKTTYIVRKALEQTETVLIVTFTRKNYQEILRNLGKQKKVKPKNIHVKTWFSFLLQETTRPYKSALFPGLPRVEGVIMPTGGISAQYVAEAQKRHYFTTDTNIYTDKLSKFAVKCNEASGGKVIARLEQIYSHIFIDEVQDLAGYDFDLVRLLLDSNINITTVGDSRQVTYHTNQLPRNAQYKGKFEEWVAAQLENGLQNTKFEPLDYSHRCVQQICTFSDKLFPGFLATNSKNHTVSGHDGVFLVHPNDIEAYYEQYKPQVLREKRTSNTRNLSAMNMGNSKGMTFNRVLIFPTSPIKTYLSIGDPAMLRPISKSKFYVALTRARQSVAIVYNGQCFDESVQRYTP